jgi:hypothetical protein
VHLTRAPHIRSIFPSKRTRPSHATRRHFYPVTFERCCRRGPPSISPSAAEMPFSISDTCDIRLIGVRLFPEFTDTWQNNQNH